MLILSDVEGVFDRDPSHPDARIVAQVSQIDQSVFALASGGTSSVGKGGMGSKLRAASVATRSGIPTVIAGGRVPDIIIRIMSRGEPLGTYFTPDEQSLASRKRWIEAVQAVGIIQVDSGAVQALQVRGSSLLAIGITGASGNFNSGDVVRILGPDGSEVGRGLTNFNAQEVVQIKGLRSAQITQQLGRSTYDEVIHRDNMSVSC
jgi:glutamate 5-kinase